MPEQTTERLPIIVRWLLESKDNVVYTIFLMLGCSVTLILLNALTAMALVLIFHVQRAWILLAPYPSAAVIFFMLGFSLMNPAISSEDRENIFQRNRFLWVVVFGVIQGWFSSESQRLTGGKSWYLDISIALAVGLAFGIFGLILPFLFGRALGRRRLTPNP